MLSITNGTYSTHVIRGDYYPHLDGIRALAVLPVVIFHVLAALCPGGFAGVDVFFVISGYLITGGIFRDLAQGRFTIRGFYHRRIRRIMPAYFVLIAVVMSAGCVLYYSRPLVHLSNTVIAATAFAANLYFNQISGSYFSPNIHDYPLLHLWSLSVEEQFYLCVPLLCALVWRLRRSRLVPILALLAILSLAGAICAMALGRQNNAFYLLHCRAWELLAGSLLALVPAVAADTRPGAAARLLERWQSPLAALGLLLVLAPYACLSSNTPFPGATALPSVIGTVLLIGCGQGGWVSRLLSWRPFVLTGKISYSLYLWHWPVIVFWKYATYNQLCACDYAGMFLLSLVLGYLSWRFVEIPVRTSPAWTPRRTFAFAAAGITLLVATGVACTCFRGWPTRLHVEANQLAGHDLPSLAVQRLVGAGIRVGASLGCRIEDPFRSCFAASGNLELGTPGKQPQLLLIGDSHAWNLQYGLAMVLQERQLAGYAMTHPNTVMFHVHDEPAGHVLDWLARQPHVTGVVLASCWMDYAPGGSNPVQPPQAWDLQLEEFAQRLQSMHRKLFVLADIPGYDYAPSDIAVRMKIIPPRQLEPGWSDHTQPAETYDRRQGAINRVLKDICRRTGAVFVPAHLALRKGDRYISFDEQEGCAVPLYGDANHLTHAGSLLAARFLAPYLLPEAP